uniref:Uncharacterized protein n=1 Tax=Rhizophora mucronata TaxID=61149 RepID=A0A2P2Q0S6_RHIMU
MAPCTPSFNRNRCQCHINAIENFSGYDEILGTEQSVMFLQVRDASSSQIFFMLLFVCVFFP